MGNCPLWPLWFQGGQTEHEDGGPEDIFYKHDGGETLLDFKKCRMGIKLFRSESVTRHVGPVCVVAALFFNFIINITVKYSS